MTLKEAQIAILRAETIIKTTYAITGEVKLFPIALEHAHKALLLAWKSSKDKKPKLLEELETLLQERKASPLEFKRKEKLVIWKKDRKTIIIDEEKVKDYIEKIKRYIKKCTTKIQPEKN